jgi:hypothetical protein
MDDDPLLQALQTALDEDLPPHSATRLGAAYLEIVVVTRECAKRLDENPYACPVFKLNYRARITRHHKVVIHRFDYLGGIKSTHKFELADPSCFKRLVESIEADR